ncbi:low temperature requirement protein A [Streptosporangium lutulentum]
MRIGLVTQWVRAGVEDPARRRTALRYATGITVLQGGWGLHLLLAATGVLSSFTQLLFFAGLAVLELMVPRWAERARATNWHPHHIAERYGLFTIILLGESVLAATKGLEGALEGAEISASFVTVVVSGLVLLFALWWLYFLTPVGEGLSDRRHRSYLWGYGHYGIFAALAALGADLEVMVEQTGHDVGASPSRSATPSRSRSACSSPCCGWSTRPSWRSPSCVPPRSWAAPPSSCSCRSRCRGSSGRRGRGDRGRLRPADHRHHRA